jgi:hypothetical protein
LEGQVNLSIEVVARSAFRPKIDVRDEIVSKETSLGVNMAEDPVLPAARCFRLGSKRSDRCAISLIAGFLISACSDDVTVRLLPDTHSGPNSNESPSADSGTATHGDSEQSAALSFYGPYDSVEIPHSQLLDFPKDFALELWVFVRSFSGGHALFNRWQLGAGDVVLTFGTPEPLSAEQLPVSEPVPFHNLAAWSLLDGTTWLTTVAPEQPSSNEWHHIAISYGGGAFKLYLDGVRVAEQASAATLPNPVGAAFIGATPRNQFPLEPEQGIRWWPPIDGYIAEVRLSSLDRYPQDFEPQPVFTSDDATLALWKLDEGAGDTAFDSGPNELHGTITGARWEPSPTPR